MADAQRPDAEVPGQLPEGVPALEDALVRLIGELDYDGLSAATIAGVSTLMRDQIALQVGSSRLPWSEQILAFARGRALPGDCVIAGKADRMSATDAAFVNASFGHGFEYDDAHRESASHPGSCVVTAAMAIGAEIGANMRDVIAGIVAGYETYTRIGNLAAPELLRRGYQPHAVLSVFGAAAVTAKMKGFDPLTTLHALAIALSHAAGTVEYASSGGSIKRVHAGIGTRSGMFAAEMAVAGITGPTAFLSGGKGFYAIFPQRLPETGAELAFAPGQPFEIERVWLKPYCCCGCTHAYIDAMRPLAPRLDEIAGITARIQPSANVVVGTSNAHAWDPQNIVQLQYSAPVQMGLALNGMGNGYVTHFDFLEGRLDLSPAVRTAQLIELVVDPTLDARYPGKFVADLTVRWKDGSSQEVFVEDPIGTASNPMPPADQAWKFGDLTTTILGAERSAALSDALELLDPDRPAREIASLYAA